MYMLIYPVSISPDMHVHAQMILQNTFVSYYSRSPVGKLI